MDYVNAPVGKAQAPAHPLQPLVAVPTTTGTGSESTTICVLDVLVAEGQDRHQPPRAAADAGRRRPDADVSPSRRWSPRPPGWTSCATRSRATPRAGTPTSTPSSPSSGCPTAAPTRSPTCGRRRRCRCWPARSATAVRDGSDDAAPREQMAMAATFAGLGFGNAGVHIPHANAYPIAGRVRDFRPAGLPGGRADGPARHGGVADRARGVPVHLRRRARSGTSAPPGCSTRRAGDGPDALPGVLAALMRDIGLPNGLAEVGYGDADVDDLVAGALQQQRLLATAPQGHRGRPGGDLPPVDGALVTDATLARTWSRRCGAGAPRRRRLGAGPGARTPPTPRSTGWRRRSWSGPRHADEMAAVLEVARASRVPR